MLPYVDRHDWLEAFGHRVSGVGFRDDLQFAVLVGCEPRPTRSEKSGSGFGELFLEGFDRSEVAGDAIRQFLGHRLLVGGQHQEEERVIPRLGRIVEDRTVGFLDDLLQRHRLVRRAGNQAVEVVHVGLEVFAVVVFKSFFAHFRSERFRRIRKFGHFVNHNSFCFRF